jgi:hypothetical protein
MRETEAQQRCTFCQLVEYLAARGMIDESDRVIIAAHVRQAHAQEGGRRGTVGGIER